MTISNIQIADKIHEVLRMIDLHTFDEPYYYPRGVVNRLNKLADDIGLENILSSNIASDLQVIINSIESEQNADVLDALNQLRVDVLDGGIAN